MVKKEKITKIDNYQQLWLLVIQNMTIDNSISDTQLVVTDVTIKGVKICIING